MKAIVVSEVGGPEKLQYTDVERPRPGPKEALVKIAASGVNFIDIYFRTGLYKADPPFTPGMEAAGIVEEVGSEVSGIKPGDRVAYAMARGSYAEYAVVPAWQLVSVPGGMDLKIAAASMLQGMTAHYLTHSTFPLKPGNTALVHAAAGGAGLMITQIANMLGARVIGTTSTGQKAQTAREAGAAEVILYTQQDFETEVKRLTEGKGVDVVYDSVGVNCLRPRGMMVSFGQASGAVGPIDPLILNQKGSLFLTRPTLAHHCATREELMWRAGDVLGWLRSGKLTLHVDKTYKLADAPRAHIDLAGRKTTGKLLLEP
ncbi:MAG: quinone oxidoreductase [Acidobacteria bacterium]|nr:quinone oxidoreductase [Acidobacteriota bacterium]